MPCHKTDLPMRAILDIGSNSIRMVIYETQGRFPVPIFNEKILCGLGRGLDVDRRLAQDAVDRAQNAIIRWVKLAQQMQIGQIDMLATAALRDAKNADALCRPIKKATGLEMRVISGAEEARLAGLGVLSAIPSARGVIGDLGGGSVEFVNVEKGQTGKQETLPLGPLRFSVDDIQALETIRPHIQTSLKSVKWMKQNAGQDFYAVGGAWRNIARIHMILTGYPLHITHQYSIPADEAIVFMRTVERMSPVRLQTMAGINRRRIPQIPYAACLMTEILQVMQPAEVVFSAFGLREGYLFDQLEPKKAKEDPFLAACRHFAKTRQRLHHETDGTVLFDWIKPIFDARFSPWLRVIHASCFLSNIAGWEHPDYRAEHALERVLRFPITGASHRERAFMAKTVSSRYAGFLINKPAYQTISYLLTEEEIRMAHAVGLAIRFALTFSGGDVACLKGVYLMREAGFLVLQGKANKRVLWGEVCLKRLRALGKSLKLPVKSAYMHG